MPGHLFCCTETIAEREKFLQIKNINKNTFKSTKTQERKLPPSYSERETLQQEKWRWQFRICQSWEILSYHLVQMCKMKFKCVRSKFLCLLKAIQEDWFTMHQNLLQCLYYQKIKFFIERMLLVLPPSYFPLQGWHILNICYK